MIMTNAERQKRWREKRNDLAAALTGKPNDVANAILRSLGPEQAKKVARALDKRLRNIKPDCPACRGSGFILMRLTTACGMPLKPRRFPCDCGADAQ